MHSIERYGIVALLFLVVTVVAVLMWDGNKEKSTEVAGSEPIANAAGAAAASVPRGADAGSARRLSLVAESQPGPLLRRARGGRAAQAERAFEAELETQGSETGGLETRREAAPLDSDPRPPEAEAFGASSQGQTPREQLAPEQVIGQRAVPLEAGTARPASVATGTYAYTVRAGDTLSEIAQRELGSAKRWQELVAANPGLDPAKLRVGKSIQVPGAKAGVNPGASPKTAAASKVKSQVAGSVKTWKVGKGENLWRIAERALGDGKRWGEIAKLNPKVNPDKLVLGQVLALPGSVGAPAKQAGSTVASAPSKARTSSSKNEPVLLASAGRRGGKVK